MAKISVPLAWAWFKAHKLFVAGAAASAGVGGTAAITSGDQPDVTYSDYEIVTLSDTVNPDGPEIEIRAPNGYGIEFEVEFINASRKMTLAGLARIDRLGDVGSYGYKDQHFLGLSEMLASSSKASYVDAYRNRIENHHGIGPADAVHDMIDEVEARGLEIIDNTPDYIPN